MVNRFVFGKFDYGETFSSREFFYLIANFGACWILSVNTCRNSLHTLGPGVILAKLLHIVDKFRQKHRPLHHLRVEPWSKPRGRGLSSPIGCDLYEWDQSEKFGRHLMEVKLNVGCAKIGRNIPIDLPNTVFNENQNKYFRGFKALGVTFLILATNMITNSTTVCYLIKQMIHYCGLNSVD